MQLTFKAVVKGLIEAYAKLFSEHQNVEIVFCLKDDTY